MPIESPIGFRYPAVGLSFHHHFVTSFAAQHRSLALGKKARRRACARCKKSFHDMESPANPGARHSIARPASSCSVGIMDLSFSLLFMCRGGRDPAEYCGRDKAIGSAIRAPLKLRGFCSGKGAASGGTGWRRAARLAFLVGREGFGGVMAGRNPRARRCAFDAPLMRLPPVLLPLREVWGVLVGARPIDTSL